MTSNAILKFPTPQSLIRDEVIRTSSGSSSSSSSSSSSKSSSRNRVAVEVGIVSSSTFLTKWRRPNDSLFSALKTTIKPTIFVP